MSPAATDTSQPATTDTPTLAPQEMSDAQLAEFFAKGTRFDKEPAEPGDTPSADQPADSAPADAVDAAASTDALSPPASETGKPEKAKKGKGVEARNVDLRAEIEENARLLRQRRELREQLEREPEPKPKADAKPDSSPAATDAPVEEDFERYANHPDFPDPEKFDDLKKWGAAAARFVAKEVAKEQFEQMWGEREQKSAAATAQARELDDAISVAEARAQADEARDPEWKAKLDPGYVRIAPLRMLPEGTTPNVMHFIKDQVMFESEHPCSLGVFMSSDEGKQWAASLTRMSPPQIIRAIAIKDASFAALDDEDTTPPSHVSAAPPPGHTLGRKASAPVDPLKAAQASGDVEAFINQRNKAQVGTR